MRYVGPKQKIGARLPKWWPSIGSQISDISGARNLCCSLQRNKFRRGCPHCRRRGRTRPEDKIHHLDACPTLGRRCTPAPGAVPTALRRGPQRTSGDTARCLLHDNALLRGSELRPAVDHRHIKIRDLLTAEQRAVRMRDGREILSARRRSAVWSTGQLLWQSYPLKRPLTCQTDLS